MIKYLSVLGSTGSIGTQTLEVAAHLGINVVGLAAGRNLDLLEEQIRRFLPRAISVAEHADAMLMQERLSDLKPAIEIWHGQEGNKVIATLPESEMVMAAMVGVNGLLPVLEALKANKAVGLANKETLVAAGDIVMPLVNSGCGSILPVDSEHSAIWQCLMGAPPHSLEKIFLTASGGPFRGWNRELLSKATLEQSLNHPVWRMGGKITIDSATMMNKGLEVIEAAHLFAVSVDQIEVVIHPQSIIHSMVRLTDGSVLAQMGFPDMRQPIQLALTYPERLQGTGRPFDPFTAESNSLTFEQPDTKTFRLLELAYIAVRQGGTMPTVLNAANEVAVARFLAGEIKFLDIDRLVEKAMNNHVKNGYCSDLSLEVVLAVDAETRRQLQKVS